MRRTDGQPLKRPRDSEYDDPSESMSPDTHERETKTEEKGDGSVTGEDSGLDMLRPGSSAIRRAALPPRTTGSQSTSLTPRRAGLQRPPTASLVAPSSKQATRTAPRQQTPPGQQKERVESLLSHLLKGRVHWLLPLGIGMIAMLVLWELGSLGLSLIMREYNNITYGMPRTYQTDAVVGHGDSKAHPSHFIAINLNHQAIVIEFPAGNPQNAKSYVVPYYILGQDSNLVPVTVEFRDVTGDGRPDMIVHIHLQAQDQTFVFVNDGKEFRPPNSSDHIKL